MTGINFRKLFYGAAAAVVLLMCGYTLRLLAAHAIDSLGALFATGTCALSAVLLGMFPADGPQTLSLREQLAPAQPPAVRRQTQPVLPQRWLGGLGNAA